MSSRTRRRRTEIEQCADSLEDAQVKMAGAINKQWPVGMKVLVERGRGYMRGEIVSAAWVGGRFCEYVLVKGWKHKRAHSVHYSSLRIDHDYER